MSPIELIKARIVWLNILDLEFAHLLDWRGWAEESILSIDYVAPFWLCELTVAEDVEAALRCIREGLEIDRAGFPDLGIDEISLTFGLIFFRYSHHADWALEAWRTMNDYGNPDEYVETGLWEQYQRNRDFNANEMDFGARLNAIFRPVAVYALRTLRSILKNPKQTRAFMRVTH